MRVDEGVARDVEGATGRASQQLYVRPRQTPSKTADLARPFERLLG